MPRTPLLLGLVETGRHNNGGINGALDKHLILEGIDQILYKHLQKWTMQYSETGSESLSSKSLGTQYSKG